MGKSLITPLAPGVRDGGSQSKIYFDARENISSYSQSGETACKPGLVVKIMWESRALGNEDAVRPGHTLMEHEKWQRLWDRNLLNLGIYRPFWCYVWRGTALELCTATVGI